MFNFASLSHRNRKLKRSKSCRPRLEWMEPRTLLSAVTWTGEAGDNNWDTPANWSTDSVPGSGDDVTIDIAANVVHSDNVTDSINSLTSTEPLTISGGTLSIASASTIGGALTISGGTLTGAGDVSVSGLVTLTTGTLSGSSTLNANGGMLIDPDELATFNLDGRTVNNAAGQTATWTGEPSGGRPSRRRTAACSTTWAHSWPRPSRFYNDSGIGAASVFIDEGSFTLNPSSRWLRNFMCRSTCPAGPSTSRATVNWTSTQAVRAPARRSTSSQPPRSTRSHTPSTRPRPSAAAGGLH